MVLFSNNLNKNLPVPLLDRSEYICIWSLISFWWCTVCSQFSVVPPRLLLGVQGKLPLTTTTTWHDQPEFKMKVVKFYSFLHMLLKYIWCNLVQSFSQVIFLVLFEIFHNSVCFFIIITVDVLRWGGIFNPYKFSAFDSYW